MNSESFKRKEEVTSNILPSFSIKKSKFLRRVGMRLFWLGLILAIIPRFFGANASNVLLALAFLGICVICYEAHNVYKEMEQLKQ